MGFINSIKKTFYLDAIKFERETWKKENMKDDFYNEFARSNSDSAMVLLPAASLISVAFLLFNAVAGRLGVVTTSVGDAVIYSALLAISLCSYIVMRALTKDIRKNSKKILGFLNFLACVYVIWASALVATGNRSAATIVVFAATLTIITQALFLQPIFSLVFVILSTAVFGVINIFDNISNDVGYHTTIGVILLSAVLYAVSYSRYYSRCRAVYNEKIINSQTLRLDEIIGQLQMQKLELEKTNKQLETAYILDRLTGVYNRWHWDETVEKMASDSIESGKNTAMIVVDIDNFKSINDTKGHAMGDICLVCIADVLKEISKRIDNCDVFRMGGEEFVVFCRDIEKGEALKAANQILKDISNIKIDGFDGMLTASLGMHIEVPKRNEDISTFLIKADNAMYDAKKQGKNRMVISLP